MGSKSGNITDKIVVFHEFLLVLHGLFSFEWMVWRLKMRGRGWVG
jgi:hypothetical protein